MQSLGTAQSAGATVSTMFTRLGASMKSAFISALPTAILVFLSMAAAKLISMRQEAARIKNLFSALQGRGKSIYTNG